MHPWRHVTERRDRSVGEDRDDRVRVDLQIGRSDVLRYPVDQRLERRRSVGIAHARGAGLRRHRVRRRTRAAASRERYSEKQAGESGKAIHRCRILCLSDGWSARLRAPHCCGARKQAWWRYWRQAGWPCRPVVPLSAERIAVWTELANGMYSIFLRTVPAADDVMKFTSFVLSET